MTENDYQDILDRNVEEVKEAIRELEDPDYAELFELEESGKNRKTIKEFLEVKVGKEDVEQASEQNEVVEEIEEETSNGLLGSFSRESVLAGGAILGLVIGLTAGLSFAGPSDAQVDTATATEGLSSLLEASPAVESYEVVSSEARKGLVYTTVNVTQQVQNQSIERQSTFYVTEDGSLIFPESRRSPIDVQETLQRIQQQQQAPANSTGQ